MKTKVFLVGVVLGLLLGSGVILILEIRNLWLGILDVIAVLMFLNAHIGENGNKKEGNKESEK